MDFGMYATYRPSYPAGVLAALREHGICGEGRVVADLGSGTGHFSEILLRAGHQVYGVEPHVGARAVAEQRLAGHYGFHSVPGSAEQTGLPTGAVDVVTAASAMHWFKPSRALGEMRRILREGRWCVALWNFRNPESSEFGKAFDAAWRELLGPPPAGNRSRIETVIVDSFFGEAAHRHRLVLPNPFPCNENQLVGLVASSSNAPPRDTAAWMTIDERFRLLHREFNEDGLVWVPYETFVCAGQV